MPVTSRMSNMELVQPSVTMASDAITRFPLDTLQMISFLAVSYVYKLSIKPLKNIETHFKNKPASERAKVLVGVQRSL